MFFGCRRLLLRFLQRDSTCFRLFFWFFFRFRKCWGQCSGAVGGKLIAVGLAANGELHGQGLLRQILGDGVENVDFCRLSGQDLRERRAFPVRAAEFQPQNCVFDQPSGADFILRQIHIVTCHPDQRLSSLRARTGQTVSRDGLSGPEALDRERADAVHRHLVPVVQLLHRDLHQLIRLTRFQHRYFRYRFRRRFQRHLRCTAGQQH